MSIYQLKTRFQNLLRPLANKIAYAGITPNQITIFTFGLSALYGLQMFLNPNNGLWFWGLPLFFFFRMGLNAIDGMIAKEHNQITNLGAILNELLDVLSDAALFLGFYNILGISNDLLWSFVFLSLLTEFSGVVPLLIGGKRHYEGPLGKSDRCVLFGIIALNHAYEVNSNWNGTILNQNLLILGLILLFYTCYNRLHNALKENKLKESPPKK